MNAGNGLESRRNLRGQRVAIHIPYYVVSARRLGGRRHAPKANGSKWQGCGSRPQNPQNPHSLVDYNSVMATDRFGATGSNGRYRELQRIERVTNSHRTSIEIAVLFCGMIRQPPDLSNSTPENGSTEVLGAAVRRRPGRPKGLPKPEGSGRQPGTPNRVGKEARELAGRYTTKAFKRLAEMLDSRDDKAAAIAAREILDRAFGKPISPTELTGKDGAPLIPAPEMSNTELASRIAFVLALGAKDVGATMPHARQPTVIDAKPAAPFAAQRAEQAREIAAPTAQPEGDTRPELTDYQRAVAAQKAEDAAARAEGRMPRPAPVWVDENRRPRAGEDFSPTTATVTRIRPRQR